jgi:uncharacterized protein (TIGR02271 family)
MAQQSILIHFDSRSDAQKAMDALAQAGIGRGAMRLLPESETTGYKRTSGTSSYDHHKDEGGFFASLGDMFLPDEDRYAYAEGMSRGGVVLSVTADEGQIDRVSEIAERHGAVDMDERETTWRREGWTGYTGDTAAGATATGTSSAIASTRGTREGEEAIPIVEENLRVGKRQVEGGRVRIRSYVVETPVEEQVNLRQEHVQVERRAVDRPVTASDEALFRDRTIEASERSEEAVASKQARVKEELVVNKDVRERTETVSDTVRRTEVDVEDDRTDTSRTGTTDTTRTDRTRR